MVLIGQVIDDLPEMVLVSREHEKSGDLALNQGGMP